MVALVDLYTTLRREGGELFRGLCPFHQEHTPSFVVYADQRRYHCYGCGAKGDAIAMVRAMEDLDFHDALRWLGRSTCCGYWCDGLTDDAGQVQPRREPAEKPQAYAKADGRVHWQPIAPMPEHVWPLLAQAGSYAKYIRAVGHKVAPVHWWIYRDGGNSPLAVDARYEYLVRRDGDVYAPGHRIQAPDGHRYTVARQVGPLLEVVEDPTLLWPAEACRQVKKDVVTWTYCQRIADGEGLAQLYHKPLPHPHPLYGLDRLYRMPAAPVLIVEGAKAADAAQRLLPGMACVTWRGGCDGTNNAAHQDWSALRGRDITIWPDADDVGRAAAWRVARHLRAIGVPRLRVVETSMLPDGWDLADA